MIRSIVIQIRPIGLEKWEANEIVRCRYRNVFSERCATGMLRASLHGRIHGASEKTFRYLHRSKELQGA